MTTPTTPTTALASFLEDFNPDCYIDADQLDADIRQLGSLYYGSIRTPETDTVVALLDYCLSKRDAMRARLAGRIAEACNRESHCDSIYARLPLSARW